MTKPTTQMIVSQAEFARLRGVSRATVTHWKNAGRLLLNSDGMVDVAASEKLLALRPAVYRGGRAKPTPGEKLLPILDQSPEEIADSTKWTLIEAQRVKEVYLALLRKQEFEIEQGELLEIEAVAQEVGREYSIVRERLLSIPGKVSASLAGCDRAVIETKLRDEIAEALAELSAPGNVETRRRPRRRHLNRKRR
jgi:phage terminase Nu1 subunit (DNA packaging protein)